MSTKTYAMGFVDGVVVVARQAGWASVKVSLTADDADLAAILHYATRTLKLIAGFGENTLELSGWDTKKKDEEKEKAKVELIEPLPPVLELGDIRNAPLHSFKRDSRGTPGPCVMQQCQHGVVEGQHCVMCYTGCQVCLHGVQVGQYCVICRERYGFAFATAIPKAS